MSRTLFSLVFTALVGFSTLVGTASAQESADLPDPHGIGLREAATPVAEEIHIFYDAILVPMKLGISFFVLGLLVWVAVRYNKKANPEPSKFSHNTPVEVAWTVIPVLILLIIAVPSFELLQVEDKMPDGQVYEYEKQSGTLFGFENDFPEARMVNKKRHIEVAAVADSGERRLLQPGRDYDVEGLGDPQVTVKLAEALPGSEHLMIRAGRTRVGKKKVLGVFGSDRSEIVPAPSITIKATGFQWGWKYSYPDFGDYEFTALMLSEQEAGKDLYRFATDNDIVIPEGETIRLITTAEDVIHSWAMPAFGVKIDAIPGRLNETWFYTEKKNTYYGQCSEICGKDHAFMPISIKVVTREEFEAWVDQRREDEGLEPMFGQQNLAAVQGGASVQAALK